MSTKKNSEPTSIRIQSKLGNELKLELRPLEDGQFEFIVNGDGFIIDKGEIDNICNYMTRMTQKPWKIRKNTVDKMKKVQELLTKKKSLFGT